jgi:preprotein translocase subunit SecF
MLKKILSLALAGFLMAVASAQPVAAGTPTKAEKEAQFVEKVKAGITQLGTGTEARVEVKLRDKTKLKGYISEASAEQFTVVDAKNGTATTVAYPQVQQVKGNNLSKGAKIAIGVGVILIPIIVALYFASAS